MSDTECPVVFLGRGGQRDLAASIAKRIGTEVTEETPDGLAVCVDADGVSLRGYGLCYRGDFLEMLPRVEKGRLAHEMIAHIAKTDVPHPTAIDATAGMGEDAFLFAACGYEVTLFERNPVVAALLKDALRRAKKHPVLGPIAARMRLCEEDSIAALPSMRADLIYLDPMFPERQKSGLIGKKLQLIQKLEHPCADEDALFRAAVASAPGKIVVKRPLKGPALAGETPGYSIKGKAIRYDCYLPLGKTEK